jgi:hypothetical protein
MKWALMEMRLDGIGRLRTGFWRRERNWDPTFSRAAGKPTSPPMVGGLGENCPRAMSALKALRTRFARFELYRF